MSSPTTSQTLITAVASIAVAAITLYGGNLITAKLRKKELDQQMIEVAIAVLQHDPKASSTEAGGTAPQGLQGGRKEGELMALRSWAKDVLDNISMDLFQVSFKEAGNELLHQPLPVAEGTGLLVMTSEPPDAEVYLNGMLIGHTPVKITQSAGAHTVRLKLGEESKTYTITLLAGQAEEINATFGRAAAGGR